MTTDQKPWRAEMPVTIVANAGDVAPTFSPSVYQDILDKCNSELDAARALAREWESLYKQEHRMRRDCGDKLDAARARIAELEAAENANLRAIGEASGAMYEPDMGPTWPGSWSEQVSVIAGLRESQRHETDRFLRIEKLIGDHGCDCECGCSAEEHDESCLRCFACKVDAALRGVSL